MKKICKYCKQEIASDQPHGGEGPATGAVVFYHYECQENEKKRYQELKK